MSSASSSWGRFAAGMTLAGVASYFLAAFAPLPDGLTLVLAFAFGPLLGMSWIGWHGFLGARRDGPWLRAACAAGLVAGALVTTMLVVQVGNGMVRADLLAEAATAADPEAARASAQASFRAVNRVQYLIDVAWDVYICIAAGLLGVLLAADPRFGRPLGAAGLLGYTGSAAALLLLVFNLRHFPYGPADVGSVDFGPLVAVWFLAAAARLLVVAGRPLPPETGAVTA